MIVVVVCLPLSSMPGAFLAVRIVCLQRVTRWCLLAMVDKRAKYKNCCPDRSSKPRQNNPTTIHRWCFGVMYPPDDYIPGKRPFQNRKKFLCTRLHYDVQSVISNQRGFIFALCMTQERLSLCYARMMFCTFYCDLIEITFFFFLRLNSRFIVVFCFKGYRVLK